MKLACDARCLLFDLLQDWTLGAYAVLELKREFRFQPEFFPQIIFPPNLMHSEVAHCLQAL